MALEPGMTMIISLLDNNSQTAWIVQELMHSGFSGLRATRPLPDDLEYAVNFAEISDILGELNDLGVPEPMLAYYEERVRQGETLVTLQIDTTMAGAVVDLIASRLRRRDRRRPYHLSVLAQPDRGGGR
ncbi:MAG TPA: hypothetical protein VLK82_24665 [Candidatus Tectomicrobia bacterium]|nr:hypothetical protein [Candidatus Tectomicrobia bacterium]